MQSSLSRLTAEFPKEPILNKLLLIDQRHTKARPWYIVHDLNATTADLKARGYRKSLLSGGVDENGRRVILHSVELHYYLPGGAHLSLRQLDGTNRKSGPGQGAKEVKAFAESESGESTGLIPFYSPVGSGLFLLHGIPRHYSAFADIATPQAHLIIQLEDAPTKRKCVAETRAALKSLTPYRKLGAPNR